MVKAKIADNLVIGLSEENMKRLRAGYPIKFIPTDIGFSEAPKAIFIFFGTTEADMEDWFRSNGLIYPDTKIIYPKEGEL